MARYGQTEDKEATPLDVDSVHPHRVTFRIPTDWATASVDITELEVLDLLTQLWEWQFKPQLIKKRKDT